MEILLIAVGAIAAVAIFAWAAQPETKRSAISANQFFKNLRDPDEGYTEEEEESLPYAYLWEGR